MQRAADLNSRRMNDSEIAITLRVNLRWTQLTAGLLQGQTPYDNAELTDRVFRMKLAALIARLPSIFHVQVR